MTDKTMTDLVGQLRDESGINGDTDIKWKAADAIEAQAREIAEWKAAADTEARMKRYAESQLSTARRDALEEAARVADDAAQRCVEQKADAPTKDHAQCWFYAQDEANKIAFAIRSLSSPVHAGEGLMRPDCTGE